MHPIDRISQFFESYIHALECFDGKGIAWHYHLPCLLLDNDTSLACSDASKLEGLFNQGIVFYKQHGLIKTTFDLWSKKSLSDKIVQVKVLWHYYNASNEKAYSCDYHYVLKLDKNKDWKIEVAVSVNEKQQIENWLRQ